MNRIARVTRLALIPLLLVTAASCGSDDETAATTTDAAASATTVAETDDEPTDTTGTTTDTAADDTGTTAAEDDEPSAAFPVVIEHKYGETTVPEAPVRVVSIGFAEHDGLLAIGVEPVAVRDWYGDQPYGTWPWAQDELGDLQPALLPSTELNFEQIAALDPDIILGVSSGMTEGDYATLSEIAPTIAQPAEYVDYGTPWDEQLRIDARALGLSDVADTVIDETLAKFAAVADEHPEFDGATAAVTFVYENLPGAYASSDTRARVLGQLGFVTPPEFDELAGDAFYFSVSQEQLSVLDTDVIVWLATDEASITAVRDMPLRPSLMANADGREVVADPLLAAAFSHASPLSFDYVIEHLVPELALAVDGDPETAVPSAAAIDPGGAAAETDLTGDAATAADVWATVFDSNVPFDEKSAHLADAEALRSTVESYTTAGQAMGGITLVPTNVAIVDDVATVTYDVLFGGTSAYTALEGEMVLTNGLWTVERDVFCSFMASARNACPAA